MPENNLVSIVVGSTSDLKKVQKSKMIKVLEMCGVGYELSVISAHRHPEELKEFCSLSLKEGKKVFIAVAGMSAALPGMIAAYIENECPVIGVPVQTDNGLNGLDSLFSMTSMPFGTPVLVPGIGEAGLGNAALAACQILALNNPEIGKRLEEYLTENSPPPLYRIKSPT